MAIDFNNKRYILDGAMGTMLQRAGMRSDETTTHFGQKHPDILTDIHRQYIDAGADIIYAATFDINRFKMDELDVSLAEAVRVAMGAANQAKREAVQQGRDVKVAMELGPLGELLEPMGTLRFEDAYDAFREVVIAAKGQGADLAVIETMTDLYEVKAAVLAVKENSELPVVVSMTFEENERTFTGVSLEAMAVTLEALGVDAMGINCSLGPVEILPMVQKLRTLTSLPVFAKPNAGLPDPATGEYDIDCEQFVSKMDAYFDAGVCMVGGCCGTSPEYIAGLAACRDAREGTAQGGAAACASSIKTAAPSASASAANAVETAETADACGRSEAEAMLETGFSHPVPAVKSVNAAESVVVCGGGANAVSSAFETELSYPASAACAGRTSGIGKTGETSFVSDDPARSARPLKVCSGTTVVCVDHVTVIGERINPTGKKRLKQALLDEDYDYILAQAIEQADAGAEILDVNVGVPSLDDVKILPQVIKKLQSVTDLPLQIDSSNPKAIEAALRIYNGKAIVNSVNGEDKVLEAVLPLVKKYGAAVVGLTLDETGIPATAEGRFAIAEKILARAMAYGIPKEDVIIDCLTLTASAQQEGADETLRAVRMVKERLGLATALGVSNISFGLPARPVVNRAFLTLAMENGLDLPIMNPNDEDMMASIFAYHVLKNKDKNAVQYIERYADAQIAGAGISRKGRQNDGQSRDGQSPAESGMAHDIFYCIEKGMKGDTVIAVEKLLQENSEMAVVNQYLIPALDRVGRGFEKGSIFLPQMLQAATAAQAGFDVVKARLAAGDEKSVSLGQVVIATVKGDIHDIGKNIVKVIMENYGYQMIDLGRDVPKETILAAVKEKDIKLVGLSALMTSTLGSMEETIVAIREEVPDCKVMVGGAVLTAEYAAQIGADFYCKDAMKSVEAAQEVFDEQI